MTGVVPPGGGGAYKVVLQDSLCKTEKAPESSYKLNGNMAELLYRPDTESISSPVAQNPGTIK